MTLSNKTYCITITRADYPLCSKETQTYDYIFNPGGYKENNFHSAFLIKIKTKNYKACIELIGSFYANSEHCAVLEDSKLTVLMNDEVVVFDLEPISLFMYKRIGDETYFSIYPISDGYLVHGELSILRLNVDLEQVWDFCGSDIWVTQNDSREAFRIADDQILLEDWNGIIYTLDMDGKLIKEER